MGDKMVGHKIMVRDCSNDAHARQYKGAFHAHVLYISRCSHGNVKGTGCRRCDEGVQ